MLSFCVCCKYLPTSYQHSQWQLCNIPILLTLISASTSASWTARSWVCLPLLAPPLNRRVPSIFLASNASHLFVLLFLDAATLISICQLWLRIGILGFGFWLCLCSYDCWKASLYPCDTVISVKLNNKMNNQNIFFDRVWDFLVRFIFRVHYV